MAGELAIQTSSPLMESETPALANLTPAQIEARARVVDWALDPEAADRERWINARAWKTHQDQRDFRQEVIVNLFELATFNPSRILDVRDFGPFARKSLQNRIASHTKHLKVVEAAIPKLEAEARSETTNEPQNAAF